MGKNGFFRSIFSPLILTGVYGFLYLPIALLIIYSFNASKLLSVWGGFSTKWYVILFEDTKLLQSGWVSLKVAFFSATLAVILGTMVALRLTRKKDFRGRTLLQGLVTAPLIVPEVVTGLSILIFFVSLKQLTGWPEARGVLTITLAHTTLATAYVTAILQSRLTTMDPSLIEAALDLGARPTRVFFSITVPLIAPALASSWLLAFALSADDLVIASFASGPEATTLPMTIFSSLKLGLSPEINAFATLVVGVIALGGLLTAGALLKQTNRFKRNS